MATIKKFILRNFKGIEEVEVDLVDRTNCPVLTLIGLNESGKTTILEGISHFVSGDRSVSGLFDGAHAKASGVGLIPMHRKAAFTSDIEVIGLVELSQKDVDDIVALGRERAQRIHVDPSVLAIPFEVTRRFRFEDSILIKSNNSWSIEIQAKGHKRSQYKKIGSTEDFWREVVKLVEERLPQVAYFPTFLVEMPARIYLREHEEEKPVNRHYRFVFQDKNQSTGSRVSSGDLQRRL
jgi:hypothetical protein